MSRGTWTMGRSPFDPRFSRFSTPHLLGRTQELERSRDVLRGIGSPHLLVVGEPGMGKSALVHQIASEAATSGDDVVSLSVDWTSPPEHLAAEIAAALGRATSPGAEPAATIRRALADATAAARAHGRCLVVIADEVATVLSTADPDAGAGLLITAGSGYRAPHVDGLHLIVAGAWDPQAVPEIEDTERIVVTPLSESDAATFLSTPFAAVGLQLSAELLHVAWHAAGGRPGQLAWMGYDLWERARSEQPTQPIDVWWLADLDHVLPATERAVAAYLGLPHPAPRPDSYAPRLGRIIT